VTTGFGHAYLAKTCPEAVQLDVLRPCDPLPPTAFSQKQWADGRAFEARVFEDLAASFEDAVVVDRAEVLEERERSTARAMIEGAPLIIGGRLPPDERGHRVGEPDLLFRVGATLKSNGLWGYVPVDVKKHAVESDTDEHGPIPSNSMPVLAWTEPSPVDAGSSTAREDDLLQLAHYQRMLQACGHAADCGDWGGIIGTELRVAWYDLDAKVWKAADHLDQPEVDRLSTLEVYNIEFAHRLEIRAAAYAHQEDPTVPLLAEPVRIDWCPQCPWRVWCMPTLEEKADLSLLPWMNSRKRRTHHELGVADLHGLAALNHRTARLLYGGVNLSDLKNLAVGLAPSTPLADVIPRRKKQLRNLEKEGFLTVADLVRLDSDTLRYQGSRIGDLPSQIDRARARLGPMPVYRRRGVDAVVVPRGGVEIDVDMENAEDGCYLWGALATVRIGDEPGQGKYRAFATWDPSIADGELVAFEEFWSWLTTMRDCADRMNNTLRAYCFNRSAENGQMKRIAARVGILPEVQAFLASEQWVDLRNVFDAQFITGRSQGLKDLAWHAGFHWSVDDPGGEEAMVQYDRAVGEDAAAQDAARRWLLRYNEDDVRATFALRDWLDGPGRLLCSIADLEANQEESVMRDGGGR
jgi:predicted RecB family nuclease